MNEAGTAAKQRTRTRAILWLAIGAGLLLVLIANSHLVYVAIVSQPECVVHLRQGEGDPKELDFTMAVQ
jgi:hypothetical protein